MEHEGRLKRLERRQWVLFVLVFGLSAIVAWDRRPRPDDPILIARRIILMDPSGNERATFDAEGAGACLRLSDEHGKTRAILDAGKTGPGLTLLDGRGKVRVLLAAEEGGPFFGLADEGGADLFRAP